MMAEMNVRGILRKTKSPPKKRNLSTRIPTDQKSDSKLIQIISHNRCDDENKTTNIPLNQLYPHSVKQKPLLERYSNPELNTALSIAKRNLGLISQPVKPIMDVNQLTPRTKALVTEKAVKKLNIVPNKAIYKQLPPINVNDSVLDVVESPRRLKMSRESCSAADPEPMLKHYLKPTKPLEHRIPMGDNDFKGEKKRTMKMLANENFLLLRESIPSISRTPQYLRFPESD